eukprot:2543162-Prymnesium_polylepis.1
MDQRQCCTRSALIIPAISVVAEPTVLARLMHTDAFAAAVASVARHLWVSEQQARESREVARVVREVDDSGIDIGRRLRPRVGWKLRPRAGWQLRPQSEPGAHPCRPARHGRSVPALDTS